MKKIVNIFALSVMAFAGVSCGFLDVKPEILTRDNFYTSKAEVEYGLAGVYGVINNEGFYGNYYSLMLSNTDDLCYYNRNTANNYSVWYTHDASSPEIYSAWTTIYQGINTANVFMNDVKDSEYDPDHACYTEARFLRAFYHFILAQAWGDVPLKTTALTDLNDPDIYCGATPQLEVLQWASDEMEACLYGDAEVPESPTAADPVLTEILAGEDLTNAPSRVTPSTICGILARVNLFMAGETIQGTTDDMKHEYFGKAMKYTKAVIDAGKHTLNDDYAQVFINMISDVYDTDFRESMWEADFLGNRSSSDNWSNGRIGDLIGLQSSPDVGTYNDVACNFAYGQYNGSLKLWNLYWREDRTDDETSIGGESNGTPGIDQAPGWDERQYWNMRPYNYKGGEITKKENGVDVIVASYKPGIDKMPYYRSTTSVFQTPADCRGIRNCGKYSREVIYEGVKGDRGTYTPVNYPILRYSDVLLMYAEAYNEYYKAPSQEAYDCVVEVRDRAGIKTRDYTEYQTYYDFRQFVRNERGRELCFESLRKYDLIRWGIFVECMKEYISDASDPLYWGPGNTASVAATTASNVQERHIVLPIPSIELGVNGLVQNPLW